MTERMRPSTLETLGLPGPHVILREGRLPAPAAEQVDALFGPSSSRGCLAISGANGIVGAGKTMQLGSDFLCLRQ